MTPEADTARDGLLSYAGEFHALGVGLLAGIAVATGHRHTTGRLLNRVVGRAPGQSPHVADAGRELAYTGAGAALGLVLVGLMTPSTDD